MHNLLSYPKMQFTRFHHTHAVTLNASRVEALTSLSITAIYPLDSFQLDILISLFIYYHKEIIRHHRQTGLLQEIDSYL